MTDLDELFRECGLARGRHFGSKSTFRHNFPDAFFIPNAWVGDANGKMWGGDLDLTGADGSRLRQVAARLNQALYILRESAANLAGEEVLRRAEAVVTAQAVTITRQGQLMVPEPVANGKVRLTRTIPPKNTGPRGREIR